MVRGVRTGQLLVPDHLLETGQAEAAIVLRPGDAGPAVIVELALPVTVELRRGAAVGRARRGGNVAFQPRARLGAEFAVGVGILQVHISLPAAR